MQDHFQSHFKKGATTLCILSLLSHGELYGYQMVQTMARLSKGQFTMREGTLYPVLYRLEQQGYLQSRKRLVGRKMERVYYRLSTEGEAFLQQLSEEYAQISAGVALVLGSTEEEIRAGD